LPSFNFEVEHLIVFELTIM